MAAVDSSGRMPAPASRVPRLFHTDTCLGLQLFTNFKVANDIIFRGLNCKSGRLTTLGMAATVNEGAKGSRRSTVRRTRTELKRTTSLQLPPTASCKEVKSGSRLIYFQEGKAKGGLEGEVVELEGELAAVEERVRRLIHLIEEKMPLYKQVIVPAQLKMSFETQRTAAG